MKIEWEFIAIVFGIVVVVLGMTQCAMQSDRLKNERDIVCIKAGGVISHWNNTCIVRTK